MHTAPNNTHTLISIPDRTSNLRMHRGIFRLILLPYQIGLPECQVMRVHILADKSTWQKIGSAFQSQTIWLPH